MTDPTTIDSTATELPADSPRMDTHQQMRAETPEPEPTSTAIVPIEGNAGAVIRADDPAEILAIAKRIATPLKQLIEDAGLSKALDRRNPDRKHVEVGGWQAAGTMLGALGGQALHAETVWTRIVLDPGTREPIRHDYTVRTFYPKSQGGGVKTEAQVTGYDWEARVEIKAPGGLVVGSAEAMCSRGESTWRDRDDYAVRSMAETRAESRAYRRAIGWIVHMAGYNPTPAEEMGHEPGQDGPPVAAGPPFGEALPAEHREKLGAAIMELLAVDDKQAARDVIAAVETPDVCGYMPLAVARAIMKIAGVAKRVRGQAANPSPGPEQATLDQAMQTGAAPAGEPAAPPSGPVAFNPATQQMEPVAGDPNLQQRNTEALSDDAKAAAGRAAADAGNPHMTPNSVDAPNLIGVDDEREAIRRLRAAGCICKKPLDMNTSHDRCPIKGHGIPF